MTADESESARLTAGLTPTWNVARAKRLIRLLAAAGCPGAYAESFVDGDDREFLLSYLIESHVEDMGDTLITLWISDGCWQVDATSTDGSALSGGTIGDVAKTHELPDEALVAAFVNTVTSWRWSLGPFDDGPLTHPQP